uniref:AAA+ ATPase domain-containing protein n=1 Tax=Oryza nivara TaxID=4536 RepID=A0A0E0FMH5_ORYNI
MEAASACTRPIMNSLLSKLSNMLSDMCDRLMRVHEDIESIRRELGAMNDQLQSLADEEELDPQRKGWRDRVRELVYDADDCIDAFIIHQLQPGRGDDADAGGIIHKILDEMKNLKARYQIASQIQKLKSRVAEESERCKRWPIPSPNSSALVKVDPRLAALYVEANRLVGIDSPREKLIELLMAERRDDGKAQGIKVVSIVGFGGLGKTTLANQVYNKIKGRYDCSVLVSVSQTPNLRNVLRSILKGVRSHTYGVSDDDDEQQLIDRLREYLKDKRYLVVLDDVWSIEDWNIIKCGFLENNYSNGVMTTTRNESLAVACCQEYNGQVYRIKPLNELDAKMLFLRRTFGSEDACPEQLKDNAKYILKKCGGVPLAIISVASLLASQEVVSKEKWDYIQNSLRFELEENSSLQWMKHVLNLSYNNLPHALRPCLLYLGMFPEDSVIKKDDLVRQWIAEGFISDKYSRDLEEVAESYFNDLANRSMIQLTEFSEGRKCRVHDLMLDFIVSKSIDENFLTIVHGEENTKGLLKAHRVSLQFNSRQEDSFFESWSGDEYILEPERMGLMHVRSLSFHGYVDSMPYLLTLKVLRVVDLMGYVSDDLDLTSICSLHRLRYLRIRRVECKLPRQIQSLQHLKTLELGQHVDIPSDISHLSSLQHLVISKNTLLPDGIGKMTAIRTLKVFNLWKNSERNIQDLGSLTNLRELKVYCSNDSGSFEDERQRKVDLLLSSLDNRGSCKNLRYLCFSKYSDDFIYTPDAFVSWSPPLSLQRLHMFPCPFYTVPEWIAQLSELTSLELNFEPMNPTDYGRGFEILTGLRYLVHLILRVQRVNLDRNIIFSSTAFPVLTCFGFSCRGPYLTFEQGALPKLQKLDIFTGVISATYAAEECRALVGIEHLQGLEQVNVGLPCWHHWPHEVKEAEDALRSAIKRNPRDPNIQIRQYGDTEDMLQDEWTMTNCSVA